MSLAEAEKLVAEWVARPEAEKELAAIRDRARAAAESVRNEARVTPEQMRQVVTI